MSPKQLSDETLLEIISIGRSTFDPIYAEKEHRSSHSELIHILQGAVTVQTSDYSVNGKKGDTIYTPANIIHRDIFNPDSNFEVYFIQFRWQEENSIRQQFSPAQLNNLSRSAKEKISHLCHQIYKEFISSLPYNQQLIKLNLLEILYTFARESAIEIGIKQIEQDDINKIRRMQIMNDAKDFIRKNFNHPISLEDIAEALDISPYYLSRIFSSASGFTLSSYLMRIRMEQALKLIEDNRLNISEIAHKVGYNDSHYFSKVFKSYFHSTPTAYRAALSIRNEEL